MSTIAKTECYIYAVDLSAYFDGELDGERMREIELHIHDCLGCRDTLAKMRLLSEALRAVSRVKIPGRPLVDKLLRELDRVDEEKEA